ncbi:MAG: DUF6437 family protein [Desulfuromonadales bacterium]|jgi:hypothetical protein|uniref:DUF64370 domain-containing protein n=2 Tax=Sphingomonadaceae TaxID=41297 RepID=A0ABX2N4W1_9SPHN|nr:MULTISPECIES: DUF6437 family protein [Sphingomonadaceae]ATW02211.1 hypothetical protein CHN51_00700 [Sphingorhabdus sp. YGSMI21]NVD28748.1 hypothetical protein [Parasphingorhabdus flavimaris]PHR18451.1 MAG: hypothetical protein COA41_10250 [Sphingopyxis sp.]|tara:strand:- start:15124 stop:15369 length:246 start_codon:yes stop_codon:yes gene_type:complete
MTRKTGALAALKKLESERAKLDTKQQELETKAAIELGRMFLGTGVETFSAKSLKRMGTVLGKMNEEQALATLKIGNSTSAR